MAAQTVRRDRILDEAFATGGDLRQVSDMFGVSVATAHRFADFVHRAQAAEPAGD
jgi:transposase